MEGNNQSIEDWKDSLTDEEWETLLKKHGHYYHDIGINETEVVQMWKDEGCPEVKLIIKADNSKLMKLKTRQITDVFVDVAFPYYCARENNYYKLTQIEGRNTIKVECVRQNLYTCKVKPVDYDFAHYLIACDDSDGRMFEYWYEDYINSITPIVK